VEDLVERNFDTAEGELLVGGVPVSRIAAQHGTPLFVYDYGTIHRTWKSLRDVLPERFQLFYSVKANPNQEILRFFIQHGCGLEIASSGELCQALAAGCPAQNIFFAGPGKTEAELDGALGAGIGEIHVESLVEARRIAALARRHGRRARIALRVNPAAEVEGGGMRMGGRPAPFGIDEDQLDAVAEAVAGETSLEVVGLHLFVGTQILDHRVLINQYRAGLDIARRLSAKMKRPLDTVDFGGGLGVPYLAHERRLDLDALSQGLAQLIGETVGDAALGHTRFVLEPGRFLIAESGVYVARVNDVKVSRGKTFVIADGGMHHHLAASGNLGQTIKRNFPVAVINKLDLPRSEVADIVGPLCTPLDMLARNIDLPWVQIGDLVGVFQAGAYARAASPLGFLSRPAPPEILVQDGGTRVIRRRGLDEDYLLDQTSLADATYQP
jgi:diaminopimelate decarboxylase